MSTQTQPQKPDDGSTSVQSMIKKMLPQIKMALPRHMDADRMARVFLTAIRRVPDLMKCTQESLAGALITASQLGLEPDGMMGHGYLIPFRNKGVLECQFMPGYRGLMKVARQSGEISTLYARAVYRRDTFEYECGLDERIVHKPYDPSFDELAAQAAAEKWDTAKYEHEIAEMTDRGPLVRVYAVAKFKDGGYQFEVMSRLEVEMVRARSKAATSGPWVTDYDPMALKTCMKRLLKWCPGSIEKDRAVGLMDRVEAGMSQELAGDIIDTTLVETPSETEKPKGALDLIVAKETAALPPKEQRVRVEDKAPAAVEQLVPKLAKKAPAQQPPAQRPDPIDRTPAPEKRMHQVGGQEVDLDDTGPCAFHKGDGVICGHEGYRFDGNYYCGNHAPVTIK